MAGPYIAMPLEIMERGLEGIPNPVLEGEEVRDGTSVYVGGRGRA